METMEDHCSIICKSTNARCKCKARITYDEKPMCLKHYNTIKSKDTCSICLEPLHAVMKLDCGHFFHKACITRWGQTNETCPLCRVDMSPKILVQVNKSYLEAMGYMIFSLPNNERQQVLLEVENAVASRYMPRLTQAFAN